LRLRVVLTDTELKATNPGALISEDLYKKLMTWVEKHYRDQLRMKDLADPKLLNEVRTALDELTQILKVGSVYPFQN
jgi:succinylarginine dihydrolase